MKKLSLRQTKQLYKSSLFRAAGTYGLFSLLNKAIPFLLLPILTRYLSPTDYGTVAIFNVMVTLTIPFVGLNCQVGYTRAFFSQEKFDSSEYMGTILIFITLTGMAILASSIFFRNILGQTVAFPPHWIWTIPVVATSLVLTQSTLRAFRVREQPRSYGIFSNSLTFLEALLAVFFIVLLGMKWEGRVISRTAVTALFGLLGVLVLKNNNWTSLQFKKLYLKHALYMGVPMIPHTLAGVLNTSIDRLFISQMVGIVDTGLYTVGYQVGAIIGFLANSFNLAYSPWLFQKLNNITKQRKEEIVRFTYIYFVLIVACAFILSLIAPFAIRVLLGKEFQSSVLFVAWVALGYAFHGMYFMVVNYIFYAEKTYLLAMVSFLGVGINIFLNYCLIKRNGAVGAAQATTLVYLITFLIVWVLSASVYDMPWFNFKKTKLPKNKT